LEALPVLAYDYPLIGIFWTTLIFFLWVIWLVLLFRTIVDVFRSDDLGGASKVLWLIFVLVFPYLGVFAYIIARGDKMAEHDLARMQAQQASMESYVRSVAGAGGGGGGVSSELARLADLKDKGVITDAEFAQQKAKLLG
jgi:Short C-terminal domain